MKSKSDLTKKVLCSLLAASTMGIFYSGDAHAARVNGKEFTADETGVVTIKDETLDQQAKSRKFVFGQGDKIVIATKDNAGTLLKNLMASGGDLGAIRAALNEGVVGVIGGEGKLDKGLYDLLVNINTGIYTNPDSDVAKALNITDISVMAGKLANLNTVPAEKDLVKTGDTNVIIGGEGSNPAVIGAVGGDLSINTGADGHFTIDINDPKYNQTVDFETEITSITRNGDVNLTVNSGNVLGGFGGSAAISVGNIDTGVITYGENVETSILNAAIKLDGSTTTTINGNVNTAVNDGANIAGFANGGGAIAIGGTSNSYVNGNTNLVIDSVVAVENSGSKTVNDGITALVSGGGLAVTTIGGTANSEVSGTTNISINNGLAGGVIGGGVAASIDLTEIGEALLDDGREIGNDDGYSDVTDGQLEGMLGMSIPNCTIIVDDVIQGGTATATTGATNISLTGTTTAAGVVGGGIAAATHSYAWRGNGSDKDEAEEHKVGEAYGNSTATVNTGKATINVAVDSSKIDENKGALVGAVKDLADAITSFDMDGLTAALEKAASDEYGGVAAIFGGGIAMSAGDANSKATATTAGADINLISGYVAGTFGGGAAIATTNANAASEMTDTININVAEDTESVGIFGNGLAYFTGSSNGGKIELTGMAETVAKDANINISGKADGVYGGGLAIDDTNAEYTNAKVETTGSATINVYDGAEVKPLNFEPLKSLAGKENTGVNESPSMGNYVAGIADAAKDIAIAGGGVAVGGGAESTVNNAEVNVYGGTVAGDVVAGGIAAYGCDETDDGNKGAHVETSTLNLYGGKITRNVYAGGSANSTDTSHKGNGGYTEAYATVANATINLAGTEVTGVLTGKGVSGGNNDKAETSTLNLIGENTLTLVQPEEGSAGAPSTKFNGFTNFNATADSVTKVEGLNDTIALIDADGTDVKVDSSAKLDINALEAGNSEDGKIYSVVSSANEASTFWTDGNLLYDRTVNYAFGTDMENNNYNITYKTLEKLTEEEQQAAVEAFTDSLGTGGEALTGVANAIITNGAAVDAEAPGAKEFFSDFTSANGTNRDIKAMALIGEAAGVTSNTISVAGDMADNSVLRLSFTQDDVTGEPKVNEDGAVWAKYIHNKHDLDGMASSLGSIDSSSDFDGVTVGVDFAKEGKIQSGIAFSYGDGDSHGSGINNDFDMWGLTLYGNIKTDDANVIGDIGFSKSDNELTGSAMGKHVKADRNVGVFTVGVRAEKLYTNGSTQIVPYTGLRYYNVAPDSYTAYYNGQKFGEFEAERQDIVTLPLGVSLRSETITESGWRIVPQADIAYVWAFGDTDSEVELNVAGGVSTLGYTVMDSGSWLGSLGVAAGKDDWTFGVGYSYQKGSHAEANRWYVDVEYSF